MLRRHPSEQVPICELVTSTVSSPTVFYRWQEFLEYGRRLRFQPKPRPNHSAEQERIGRLEKKIMIWPN